MPPKNNNSDRQTKSKSVPSSSSSSSSGLPWTYIILYLIQSIIATIFLISLAIDWDVPFPEVWKLLDVLKEKASHFVSWPVFYQLFALEGFPKYFKFDIGMVFYTFRWKWLDNTASWAFADLWFSLIDPVQLWCIVEFTRVGMKFVWLIYFVQQFIALSIMWPLYLIYYLIVLTKYYPDPKKPLPGVNNWNVIVGFLTALTLLIPRWWLRIIPIDNIWNDFWLMIFIMGPAFVPFLLLITNFFGRSSSEQFYDIFLAFLAGGEYGIQRASVTHAFWQYGWKGFLDGSFISDMITTDMEKFLAYDFSVSIFSTFLLFTFLLRREGFSVSKTIFSLIGLALLAVTLSPAFLIIGFRLLVIHYKKTTKTE